MGISRALVTVHCPSFASCFSCDERHRKITRLNRRAECHLLTPFECDGDDNWMVKALPLEGSNEASSSSFRKGKGVEPEKLTSPRAPFQLLTVIMATTVIKLPPVAAFCHLLLSPLCLEINQPTLEAVDVTIVFVHLLCMTWCVQSCQRWVLREAACVTLRVGNGASYRALWCVFYVSL